jgi:6-phosphogluconate dehydrogenase
MQVGMIGLGRMRANMVRRLLKAGHECVAYDAAVRRTSVMFEAFGREMQSQSRRPAARWAKCS